jgi:predicted alpha/beta hydrolase
MPTPDSTPRTATPRDLPVTTPDGHRTVLRLFAPEAPPRVGFLVLPAMGVAARYYDRLGTALSEAGVFAAVADLRGQGASNLRAGRSVNWGYHEAVVHDLPALIAATREAVGAAPLYVLGHSLGGHLAALHVALRPDAVAGLVLVASGTTWHRNWPAPHRFVLLAQMQLGGLIAGTLGYFPGKRLGFADRQARREMADWAALGRHGRFAPRGPRVDYEAALARVRLPVWSYTFEGDTYTPRAAADHLVDKLSAAAVERVHLGPADVPAACLHHFQWARHPGPVVAHILRAIRLTAAQSDTKRVEDVNDPRGTSPA